MRARADERQVALEDTLKSCGSSSRLVLRMKRPTRVTRGSSLVTSLAAVASAWSTIHGAELVDFDQLVVEAVALLLEQDRAVAVELDGERDERHHRVRGRAAPA